MDETIKSRVRISSIDVLRGIVMVIMALDHVRDFFFKVDMQGAATVATDPTNMETTTPALFFTRWITHFCAPVFVFLTGTSAWLYGKNKSKKDLSFFLITRGLWLVIAECLIITFGWSFDPSYPLFFLQVIWALGISMIILGSVIFLPKQIVLAIGLIIVFGHNILGYPSVAEKLSGNIWADLIYYSQFSFYNIVDGHSIIIVYAFLPWAGLMMIGYGFGSIYTSGIPAPKRRTILITIGILLIIIFIALRLPNLYGDPVDWSTQPRGSIYSFLSFLNTNKYPPSLLFLCMTIGPALIMLALLERVQNGLTRIMNVYGRVPMFYYILHFFIIHGLVVIVFFATGYTTDEIRHPQSPFLFRPPDFGFPLWGVYVVWIFTVIVLYPLCKKYDQYKSTHKKWWLSYI